MAIQIERIATNRYAPEASNAINLYSNGLEGGSGLTLGQLVIAVSMRSAAVYEAESVIKMNKLADGSELLGKTSEYMQGLADDTIRYTDWPAIKNYLVDTVGVTATLPDTIDTYTKRLTAIAAIKARVDALTQVQQEEMINLQTLVNRRDVAFSASSNMVRALGSSMNTEAEKLL